MIFILNSIHSINSLLSSRFYTRTVESFAIHSNPQHSTEKSLIDCLESLKFPQILAHFSESCPSISLRLRAGVHTIHWLRLIHVNNFWIN